MKKISKCKEWKIINITVRKKLIDYLREKEMSVYRFSKDSGIPQSTIWSIIRKEDYEVREKNIHKICSGMGISVGEILGQEDDKMMNLRTKEIPVVAKYRSLNELDQCRVQGYVDALIEKTSNKTENRF